MRILVLGAGLSGCTIARLLKNEGNNVQIFEKKDCIGGLCVTRINEDDIPYEPYGARTFHASDSKIWDFITSFAPFNGYIHRKGMIISGKTFPFPLSIDDLMDFKDGDSIVEELNHLPCEIDVANFETAAISVFGKRLYRYFVQNYSMKMWGCDLKSLSADLVPKRLELRGAGGGKEGLFGKQQQGLPCGGYSILLEKMIQGIPVALNTSYFSAENFDLVISTAPIDELLQYRHGHLRYRSLRFDYAKDESWEKDDWGTINLPDHPRYIRKCNFKVLHKIEAVHNWIQYQEPLEADSFNEPMYPMNTKDNEGLFIEYLKDICRTNILPLVRLGLYKYLDMDKAVSCAFEISSLAGSYLSLGFTQRFDAITAIRNRY